MSLTLEQANVVTKGAVAKAKELGIKINVAVCDVGGRLVAFQRMDNAMWAGVYGSQGKAVASAAFGRASGDLTDRAGHPTMTGIRVHEGDHMILGQGGLPIVQDGLVIGAVGVGGGTAEEDEECSHAGVERL